MDDARPVSGAIKKIFSIGTGRGVSMMSTMTEIECIHAFMLVPVIAICTKFDAFVTFCWNDLGDDKFKADSIEIAKQRAQEQFDKLYLSQIMETDYSPKALLCLSGIFNLYINFLDFDYWIDMHKESNKCPELTEKTAEALDNKVLQNLFVSTQMNNLALSMKYGIR